MIKHVVLTLTLVLACSVAQAATVYLKNGSTVSGRFLVRTDDSIKIDVSGVTLTYYNDEIDRVEGENNKDDTSAPQEPTAPAAVQSPTPAASAAPVAVQSPAPAVSGAPVAPQPSAPAAPAGQATAEAPQAVPKPVAEATTATVKPSAQVDPYAGMSKRSLILKFIEVYGTKRMMALNFDQMMNQMMNQITPKGVEVFKRIIKVDDIVQELLPIYDKHFSEEDLKALINFYSTPIGRKLVETIPLLMNESIEVSAKYFEAHLPELATELKKAGIGK